MKGLILTVVLLAGSIRATVETPLAALDALAESSADQWSGFGGNGQPGFGSSPSAYTFSDYSWCSPGTLGSSISTITTANPPTCGANIVTAAGDALYSFDYASNSLNTITDSSSPSNTFGYGPLAAVGGIGAVQSGYILNTASGTTIYTSNVTISDYQTMVILHFTHTGAAATYGGNPPGASGACPSGHVSNCTTPTPFSCTAACTVVFCTQVFYGASVTAGMIGGTLATLAGTNTGSLTGSVGQACEYATLMSGYTSITASMNESGFSDLVAYTVGVLQ